MPPEIVVDTHEALASLLAGRFEKAVRDAVRARGRFACALPGGSVAEVFFTALAPLDLPLPPVHVFFGDERAVPPSDPDSNLGLARRLWLDAVPATVHPMPADQPDLAAAASYAAELRAVLGDPPRLDVALFGIRP